MCVCVCLGERGSEGGGGAMCSETGVCLYVGRPLSPDILITSGLISDGPQHLVKRRTK